MQSRKVSTFAEKINQNRMNTMKLRITATLALAVIATNMASACNKEMTVTDTQAGMAQQVPTAKEWNQGVVGGNLGNQFECSARVRMASQPRLATLTAASTLRRLGATLW